MADLTLVIGDKNLSSWSLRPWVALTHAGIPFKEEKILLDRPESRAQLRRLSPSGLVPFLRHGEVTVWDSLAILEYVNEQFPDAGLLPDDPAARAHARSLAAEMHSGFGNLRTVWPMNFVRRDLSFLTAGGVQRDIDRIGALWTEARETFGVAAEGPFLYGRFSIADAMYAPVASRFRTYGPVDLPAPAQAWAEMIMETPAMRAWGDGAAEEVAAE